jgi:hypothetical protein
MAVQKNLKKKNQNCNKIILNNNLILLKKKTKLFNKVNFNIKNLFY